VTAKQHDRVSFRPQAESLESSHHGFCHLDLDLATPM
jgi:hypothetical protein